MYVKLYLLKKNEKEVFKKKQEWHIRDLKILDGVSNESLDVKMDLGKSCKSFTKNRLQMFPYKWHDKIVVLISYFVPMDSNNDSLVEHRLV